MKWLTLSLIKAHTRIDGDAEDEVLELYGASAENTCLAIMNRTMEDLVSEYGEVPSDVIHASLILTAHSYTHREPSSPQQLYAVPYAIDAKLAPYMNSNVDWE